MVRQERRACPVFSGGPARPIDKSCASNGPNPSQEINVKKLLNYLSVLLVLSVFTFSITACNTVHGVGKDMQKAGEEVQEEADEHKHDD
jgi:predicted small secreted protein